MKAVGSGDGDYWRLDVGGSSETKLRKVTFFQMWSDLTQLLPMGVKTTARM